MALNCLAGNAQFLCMSLVTVCCFHVYVCLVSLFVFLSLPFCLLLLLCLSTNCIDFVLSIDHLSFYLHYPYVFAFCYVYFPLSTNKPLFVWALWIEFALFMKISELFSFINAGCSECLTLRNSILWHAQRQV